jgi:phosphatidylethanolamine N-methyltransferase
MLANLLSLYFSRSHVSRYLRANIVSSRLTPYLRPETDIERTYGQRKPIAMRTPLALNLQAKDLQSPVLSSDDLQKLQRKEHTRTVSREHTPRPRKPMTSSNTSSADNADSLADTPYATDASDYDTDTDDATHKFRRDSTASSTMSEDLDAEYEEEEAHAPGSFTSSSDLSHNLGINTVKPHLRSKHDFDAWYFRQDTIIFQNFDPLRATDFAFGLAVFYLCAAFILPYLSPRQQLVAIFMNALAWRLGHTFGLGSILKAQSEKKWLVRHYLSKIELYTLVVYCH